MSWISTSKAVHPFVDELFTKMPDALLPTVIKKIREFALSVTDLQLAADGYTLMAACSEKCKDVAVQELLKPLVQSVDALSHGLAGAQRFLW
jgi:hypothetical protein